MAMDAEQFKQFLESMRSQLADHDLLVGIAKTVELNLKNYDEFKSEIIKKNGTLEKAISAAHRRIDWLMVGGFVTIITGFVAAATFFMKTGGG